MEVDDMAVRVEDLRNDGADSGAALAELRPLMTSVAWFELERRRAQVSDLSTAQVARLVRDASERAGVAALKRLGDYRGQSRFEVWAAKFAIHETALAARRHNDATARHRGKINARGEVNERCLHSSR
jgi:hypothetical protein